LTVPLIAIGKLLPRCISARQRDARPGQTFASGKKQGQTAKDDQRKNAMAGWSLSIRRPSQGAERQSPEITLTQGYRLERAAAARG
jgi:hypothetical protein